MLQCSPLAQEAAANLPFGLRALPYKTLICSSRHLQKILCFVIKSKTVQLQNYRPYYLSYKENEGVVSIQN